MQKKIVLFVTVFVTLIMPFKIVAVGTNQKILNELIDTYKIYHNKIRRDNFITNDAERIRAMSGLLKMQNRLNFNEDLNYRTNFYFDNIGEVTLIHVNLSDKVSAGIKIINEYNEVINALSFVSDGGFQKLSKEQRIERRNLINRKYKLSRQYRKMIYNDQIDYNYRVLLAWENVLYADTLRKNNVDNAINEMEGIIYELLIQTMNGIYSNEERLNLNAQYLIYIKYLWQINNLYGVKSRLLTIIANDTIQTIKLAENVWWKFKFLKRNGVINFLAIEEYIHSLEKDICSVNYIREFKDNGRGFIEDSHYRAAQIEYVNKYKNIYSIFINTFPVNKINEIYDSHYSDYQKEEPPYTETTEGYQFIRDLWKIHDNMCTSIGEQR